MNDALGRHLSGGSGVFIAGGMAQSASDHYFLQIITLTGSPAPNTWSNAGDLQISSDHLEKRLTGVTVLSS